MRNKKIIEDDSDNKLYKKLKFSWALIASTRQMSNKDIEQSYHQFKKEKFQRPSKTTFIKIKHLLPYAAVLAIGLMVSWIVFYKNANTKLTNPQYTSVVADHGQISKVVLPDSTIIWLNSGSTLKYNSNYSVDNRNLDLTGQAYLDVKTNINLPLIVSCKDINIRVLGTQFDVCSYPNDDQVSVKLDEGSIELFHAENTSKKTRLKLGDLAVYNLTNNEIGISNNQKPYYSEWRNGMLTFVNTEMKYVIKELERKFDIEVIVMDSDILNSKLNGRFKNTSLEQIAAFIELACQIDATIIKENEINTKLILKAYN